jgi:hypothetical protein
MIKVCPPHRGHPYTRLVAGLLLAVLSTASLAQSTRPAAQEIYTCIDAKGRNLTSDRPIAECLDREQKMLNPSGTVKAKVGPNLTAQERSELEAKEKAELEERARLNEEKRRDRALLVRYPNKTVHDKERAVALAQIGVVRQAAVTRVDELQRQRAAVLDEMEFYKKDPSKAPASVRRQLEEVNISLAVQARFIAEQDAEVKRVTFRFEEELFRLKQLWALQAGVPAASANKTR